jgi:phosphatidylglycerol---prolipoprotein diacylglyceryl transferase
MNNFLIWWQHLPGHINPIFLDWGGFQIHYYGLMYLVAFATTYTLALTIRKRPQYTGFITKEEIQTVMLYAIFGVMIGGRLGYVLFYNLEYFISNPLEIILPFSTQEGLSYTGLNGMSFHGGLIGVAIAIVIFAKKYRKDIWRIADFFAPIAPLGFTFGRIGNFINGELWGRVTTSPIGMYFPFAPGHDRRHPSQLYEALGEGLLLFLILQFLAYRQYQLNQKKDSRGARYLPKGSMLSCYLIGYGLIRFIIEFWREPDAHLGTIALNLSMGQLLSLAMIVVGTGLWWKLSTTHKKEELTRATTNR